jgi:2,5-furandicarboxylate decarboxylase 1
MQNLYLPPSGCCQFFCYVALAKSSDAEPRQVIDATLRANVWVKYVIVVNPDIDVFDESEVLWAVERPARRWTRRPRMGFRSGGIDATLPADGSFPERVGLPKDVLARVSLSDYGL